MVSTRIGNADWCGRPVENAQMPASWRPADFQARNAWHRVRGKTSAAVYDHRVHQDIRHVGTEQQVAPVRAHLGQSCHADDLDGQAERGALSAWRRTWNSNVGDAASGENLSVAHFENFMRFVVERVIDKRVSQPVTRFP